MIMRYPTIISATTVIMGCISMYIPSAAIILFTGTILLIIPTLPITHLAIIPGIKAIPQVEIIGVIMEALTITLARIKMYWDAMDS